MLGAEGHRCAMGKACESHRWCWWWSNRGVWQGQGVRVVQVSVSVMVGHQGGMAEVRGLDLTVSGSRALVFWACAVQPQQAQGNVWSGVGADTRPEAETARGSEVVVLATLRGLLRGKHQAVRLRCVLMLVWREHMQARSAVSMA